MTARVTHIGSSAADRVRYTYLTGTRTRRPEEADS
jgi:hypothetical protein